MENQQITERTFQFALRIIKLCRALQKEYIGRTLSGQLLRAGTSVGANIEESQAAQSTADFIAKMSIARKESRETLFWLRLIRESKMVPAQRLEKIILECDEITKIISSIIINTRKNASKENSPE